MSLTTEGALVPSSFRPATFPLSREGDRADCSTPRHFILLILRARAAWRVVAEGLDPQAVTPGERPMGCSLCMAEQDQANRAISTSQLHTLPRFHTWPINVVVFHGSQGRTGFEGGFPLRCFQQLSLPYLATRLCRWRDNRSTRGTSTPVLSYWGQLLAILQHPRQIGTELSHDVLNPTHVPL